MWCSAPRSRGKSDRSHSSITRLAGYQILGTCPPFAVIYEFQMVSIYLVAFLRNDISLSAILHVTRNSIFPAFQTTTSPPPPAEFSNSYLFRFIIVGSTCNHLSRRNRPSTLCNAIQMRLLIIKLAQTSIGSILGIAVKANRAKPTGHE